MRLATFNILHGRSPVDGAVDLDRFADAVRRLDADVLALQEVDRDQPRSQLADLTAVASDAMGARSHRFVAALAGTPGATWLAATGEEQPGTATYGVALLSRYPVHSWQVIRLPPLRARFPMWSRGARRVIVVDEEPRVAVAGLVATPHGDVTCACTHLSFVPLWNALQLRRLRRDLGSLPGPLVLMGDLNMAGRRPARITGYHSLASAPTFPADAPTRQLDHILLRGSLPPVGAVESPELPLSDHRPLVAELTEV
jgi:endonuclease/exonuclease/phosphatase family metal-dependent hydrolase